jgi:hypothetical protein
MIDKAVTAIIDELSHYIQARIGNTNSEAKAAYLVNEQGALAFDNSQLAVMLVGIHEEKLGKSPVPTVREIGNGYGYVNPDINLNFHLVFGAHFNVYMVSLQWISFVVSFFQIKSVFTHANTPGLDNKIEKLYVELVSPSFEELNHLWATIGAKYMPSALYKIRMVTIQEDQVTANAALVTQVTVRKAGGE